jgi:hypothetical protein
MGKMVEVTVARRRSIFTNAPLRDENAPYSKENQPTGPGKFHGPGSKVMVDESELERLFKQGFIIDPHAKKVTAAEVEAADLSDYVPQDGDVTVSEKTDQAVKKGRG